MEKSRLVNRSLDIGLLVVGRRGQAIAANRDMASAKTVG